MLRRKPSARHRRGRRWLRRLLAGVLLWLANRKAIMGTHRNGKWANILGGVGLVILLLVAVRILWYVGLSMT